MPNLTNAITPSSLCRVFVALGLLVAFVAPASLALAGTSGGIAGTVTDSTTGAPLPGADLRISSPSQTVTTTTDSHGHYIVFNLQPDDYTITAAKAGYDAQSFTGDSVSADQTQRYDLILTPSSAAPPGP
jgi:large repetitive protein